MVMIVITGLKVKIKTIEPEMLELAMVHNHPLRVNPRKEYLQRERF